jgi:hypothetical protein
MGHNPTASHTVWHGRCGRVGGRARRGQGDRVGRCGQGWKAEGQSWDMGLPWIMGHGASKMGHTSSSVFFSIIAVKVSCLHRIL